MPVPAPDPPLPSAQARAPRTQAARTRAVAPPPALTRAVAPPPAAIAARPHTDPVVWTLACAVYADLIDPSTGAALPEPEETNAETTPQRLAGECAAAATSAAATHGRSAAENYRAAAGHADVAAHHQDCAHTDPDPSAGPPGTAPDGGLTGAELRERDRLNRSLGRRRAAHGDTAHLHHAVPAAVGTALVVLLGLADLLLLWRPVLRLSLSGSAAGTPAWLLAGSLVAVQCAALDAALRRLRGAAGERADRRSELTDAGRLLLAGRGEGVTGVSPPDAGSLRIAESLLADARRGLLTVAAGTGVLAGVRAAVLAGRVGAGPVVTVTIASAAGLVPAAAAVLLAAACARGNGLGERLRADAAAVAAMDARRADEIRLAVAARHAAAQRLASGDADSAQARAVWLDTARQYWAAVGTACGWAGIPLPDAAPGPGCDAVTRRNRQLRAAAELRLAVVDQWLRAHWDHSAPPPAAPGPARRVAARCLPPLGRRGAAGRRATRAGGRATTGGGPPAASAARRGR